MEKENPKSEGRLPLVGITIGDANGIGPEIILKTLMDRKHEKEIGIVIYGQSKVLTHYMKILGIKEFRFQTINDLKEVKPKRIHLFHCHVEEGKVEPGKPSQYSGELAKKALEQAGDHLKNGEIKAVVTAPVSKANLQSRGFSFPGQTEFFANLDPQAKPMMLLVSDQLRIGLTTGHVPIKDLGTQITSERVEQKLRTLLKSLKADFGISKPRVGVLGINPHAGEEGKIGKEEVDWLNPLIEKYKEEGHLVFGPLASDGLFGSGNYRKFDGILGMYHDQALIPFKTLAFESGVNCTVGLSFIRTSPDHGTAFDMAGKDQASPSSFRAALNLAKDLIRQRSSVT